MAIQIDPQKAAGWTGFIIGAATIVTYPFRVFAKKSAVTHLYTRVEDLEKEAVTKQDFASFEQRMKETMAGNHSDLKSTTEKALERGFNKIDAFIDTVNLLQKSKEEKHDQGDGKPVRV